MTARRRASGQLDLPTSRKLGIKPSGAEPKRFTCPACGFYFDFLDGSAPTYGRLTCDECGYSFDVDPRPMPTDSIHFRGAGELDAGAAQVREIVARIKRGDE